MKTCPKCKRAQPREGFNANTRSKDGLGFWCRDCMRSHRDKTADSIRKKKAADYLANRERVRAQQASYRAANRSRARARDATYYAANLERIRAAQAVYRKENAKSVSAQKSAWASANKDRVAAGRKARYVADPSRQKERSDKWKKSHPDAVAANWARQRSQKRNAPGTGVSATQWRDFVRDSLGICAYCHRRARLTMDHVVPLSLGGRHEVGNVVGACFSCNSSKCDTPLVVWLARKANHLDMSGGFRFSSR